MTAVLINGCSSERDSSPLLPIIPQPALVSQVDGQFRMDESSAFHVMDMSLESVAEHFQSMWSTSTGLPLPVSSDRGSIVLSIDTGLADEHYVLRVTDSAIRIRGADAAGVFYGLQTVRQMLPPEIESPVRAPGVDWIVPGVTIEDGPRFSYRGLHLDVGRHFFDVDHIKKTLDAMSLVKLNTFHWHLTEDQGWRLEIDAYPRLTEVGAWRRETVVEKNLNPYIGDGTRHGGFYTKDEVRDILDYAAERFITVIPEIELPGHAGAALASYPELGCHDGPYEVKTTWGIQRDIFCPSEQTFTFLKNVLTEVAELFPGPYIHIGGDEVPKVQWEESDLAQQVMAREGLQSEEELQSWFIREIETHLNALGKNLIGWDEILEGGLAPNATVMSWRGTVGGIAAARAGHDVVMTPTDYLYFDFYQGDPETEPLAMNWANRIIPLDTVYAYDPIPPELTSDEASHILGAQGNVWTEYISTPEYAEYMTWPRAHALAEITWSPQESRDIQNFYLRLVGVLQHFERLGINYRIPEKLDAFYVQPSDET